MSWLRLDQAPAYCPGCGQNVWDGWPGLETECVASGRMVVLEAPRPDARNILLKQTHKPEEGT
jgi:hypothetical protein